MLPGFFIGVVKTSVPVGVRAGREPMGDVGPARKRSRGRVQWRGGRSYFLGSTTTLKNSDGRRKTKFYNAN